MSEFKDIEEAKQLAAGPLGLEMARFPLLFAKAVLFGQRPSRIRQSQLRNGTASLVDLGGGPLAITCEHVIAEYSKMTKAHDNLVFSDWLYRGQPSRTVN